MIKKKPGRKDKDGYPSLYDVFKLGERVARVYIDENGRSIKQRGIILGINNDGLQILWDMKDGSYSSVDDNSFTSCSVDEVFKGRGFYSSIKKDR